MRQILIAVALALTLCGCPKKPATGEVGPPPGDPEPSVTHPPDPATLGTVAGRVRFAGTPPKRAEISMGEAACADHGALDETTIVAADGGLANVLVSVSAGLDPAIAWPVPTEAAVISQKHCIYSPHVLGMRARQPLEVRNDEDTVTHNVHLHSRHNYGNFSQGPQKWDRLTTTSKFRTFERPEEPFAVQCDIHGWMKCWIGVFRHPLFAVTAPDGSFRIEGVPEGKLTLRFWHEKLGMQEIAVEVKRGAVTTAEAEFK